MQNLPLSLLLSSTGCASAGSVYTSRFVGYRDTGYVRETHTAPLSLRWHVTQLRNGVRTAKAVHVALRPGALRPHVDSILADGMRSDELRALLATDFVVNFGHEAGIAHILRMLADPSWSAPGASVRARFTAQWPQAAAVLDDARVW